MAKIESNFRNMFLTLFVVTLIASTSLGYVYEITKGPKAAAELAKKVKAIEKVIPKFTNNPLDDKYELDFEGDSFVFYPGRNNDKLVGTAVSTVSHKGYGGDVKLMVGLLPDGTISNVAVISHKATPGLGDKMEKKKSDFSLQFNDKNPARFELQVKADGGDIDAITAATISSRAFCDAVQRAYDVYMKEKK